MPTACDRRRFVACLTFLFLSAPVFAADWPTYRGDNARSGSTSEKLTAPFTVRWHFESPADPRMSFSGAEGRVIEGKMLGSRIKYDDAFHPAIVGGKVYFGSSVDDQLHCIDLKTGKELWTFFTGGPVRLAPTVTDGRVYFGSDDGHAYCLSADDGKLIWQMRAGPEEDWLIGRGQMVSRWPVRSSVLVDSGIAYFGAGIFPHEDVYLYAVDAADGSLVWKQDNLSVQDAGRNDISPQGYFLASDDLLFVPSGRSLPAAFDRKTGELVHRRSYSWRSTAGGVVGGTQALLSDGQIYASGPHHLLAMEQSNGDVGFGWFAGRQMVVQGDAAYVATGTVVARLDRTAYAVNSRRRHELEMDVYSLSRQVRGADGDKKAEIQKKMDAANAELLQIADVGVKWQKETIDDAFLMSSGDLVFLGGTDRVRAYDAESGDRVWEAPVKGKARGLAAANGHLFVSTTAGSVYCFAPVSAGVGEQEPGQEIVENPYPQDELSSVYAKAADEILDNAGVYRGFCLVVDGEEGRLGFEIAKRSKLDVYVVEPDAEKVKRARAALSRAGVYGHRVTVHQFDPSAIPYANYFANLIVSDRFVKEGKLGVDLAKISRHLKPDGGVLDLGTPKSNDAVPAKAAVASAISPAGLSPEEATVETEEGWAKIERGPLPGAGNWSHQYGNASNTAVSNDHRIKGGLGVLWYGDPGPGEMVNRHDGAVGPLATGGRLFVQGESTIRAYDAYNGLFLWNYDNPSAIRTGVYQNVSPGNLAANDDRLFQFLGHECFELDAATGKIVRVHRLPKEKDDGKHQWAYVAVEGDLLFGTATILEDIDARARRRGRRTKDATDAIFAIDLKTGKHLWTYQGQSISHRTIALAPERVYFIDSTITSEQRAAILRQDKSELEHLTGKEREIAEDRLKKADLRRAVGLNARTGEKLWENPVDVTDCSEIGIGGGMLTLMYQDGTLILCGANANGHYWRQFVAGEFARRRLVALSAEDGYKIWAKDANYRHRPIIVGDKVLAEPWMFDLKTGDQITRTNPLTGEDVPWSFMRTGHHCGMLTACDSGMLMFRSGFTGFMDLEEDAGVRHFAGHRLGCWINAIPANGLVMIPEASAGCVCLFSIASTIVLEPREARRPWSIYSAVGAETPVKHMAINLGAPGDRKDARGNVWLSYPRYKAYQETSLDVKLDLKPQFTGGRDFHSINEDAVSLPGVETPWLYTSWADGLKKLTLPLLGEGDAPATYTVRLHFADLREDRQTDSVLDVKLNGQTVATDLTVPASGKQVVVSEFGDVSVTGGLTIELDAKQGTPLLNAIEVHRVE